MRKTPLDRLGQYQAGLALASVLLLGVGLFAPWGYDQSPIRTVLLVGGAISLLTLLVSVPVHLAAAAIIEAREDARAD